MYTKDFNEAMRVCMLSEIGPWFREDHPACISGVIKSKADRVATGYVNDPDDKGGETKFGIARNSNPNLNITALTYEQAKSVYFRKRLVPGLERIIQRVLVVLLNQKQIELQQDM